MAVFSCPEVTLCGSQDITVHMCIYKYIYVCLKKKISSGSLANNSGSLGFVCVCVCDMNVSLCLCKCSWLRDGVP